MLPLRHNRSFLKEEKPASRQLLGQIPASVLPFPQTKFWVLRFLSSLCSDPKPGSPSSFKFDLIAGTRNPFSRLLKTLEKQGGGEFSKYYILPSLNDSRIVLLGSLMNKGYLDKYRYFFSLVWSSTSRKMVSGRVIWTINYVAKDIE
ncbi:hypothetical protein L2E82_47441 [Cichorium intybus]|uniref:Uncharacterized protein n=1 Tax=Cichorium intybus TaxID=13427 RepID=A0ACB8YW13_CICIN|nr:hypothetical protein L2E82_47441 [Cichorium intybus]